ncbi:hypothetical protein GJ496_008248, partial [Pomphorhynchus laevis]
DHAIEYDMFDEEDLEETANEKRHRLALQYVEDIKSEAIAKQADDVDDFVSKRLQDEYLDSCGRLQHDIADRILQSISRTHTFKGHRRCLTCAKCTSDNKFLFSSSKDGTIIKYSVDTGKRLHIFKRQTSHTNQQSITGHLISVNCLDITHDDKLMVSGDSHGFIMMWNAESCDHNKTLRAHRKGITDLVIRKNTFQLFTCSEDKTIKLFDLTDMVYLETLFQHDDVISSIDALLCERCISVGGQDQTMRLWKIAEESHLVFKSAGYDIFALDCVSVLNDQHAVTGDQSGSIAVWSFGKRKPLVILKNAHKDENGKGTCISSVAAARNADFIVSGSHDGFARIWKCSSNFQKLELINEFCVTGFINCIYISPDYHHLYLACGKEHRLGRWWFDKSYSNCVFSFALL